MTSIMSLRSTAVSRHVAPAWWTQIVLLAVGCIGLAAPALADGGQLTFGGDQYAGGQAAQIDAPVARDAFAAGYDVSLRAPVAGDAHLAGFNVTQAADVAGNLYAAGFSVSITGNVGGDVTAMANSIALASPQPVGGNVRLAGQTLNVSAEIAGSALLTGQTVTLAAPVKGDVSFVGEALNFGPNARVDGTLTIRAPREIAVPASVAAAERVHFEQLVAPDYATEAGKTAEHVVRGVWPAVWATGLWWLLLFIAGLVVITLLPRVTQALEVAGSAHPFRRLGLGFVTFAAVVGLVPVLAMTILGLALIPFALLFDVLACALGYVAGAYLVGGRIAQAMLPIDSNVKRAAVLAASIVVAGLLGMIPIVGWLITLVVLCFGFGAIARAILGPAERPPQPALAAAAPAPQ